MTKIKLAIVDDEGLIVELLANFFAKLENIEVSLTAGSGEEFLKKLDKTTKPPNIVLLDLRMKKMDGMETLTILKQKFPNIKTIIMSSYYKKNLMGYMLKLGVNAFIPKGISPEQLLEIIIAVNEKDYFFMNEQIEELRKQLSDKIPKPKIIQEEKLSIREQEILSLICEQKTAQEISELLFISKRTVEGHRTNLLLKTGAKNTAGLVIYAIQNKIIDPNIPF